MLFRSPGLRPVVGMAPVTDGLQEAYRSPLEELEKNEEAASFGAFLGALPLVRTCQSTGQAAVWREKASGEFLSAEARAKRKVVGHQKAPGGAPRPRPGLPGQGAAIARCRSWHMMSRHGLWAGAGNARRTSTVWKSPKPTWISARGMGLPAGEFPYGSVLP